MNDTHSQVLPTYWYLSDTYPISTLEKYDAHQIDIIRKKDNIIYNEGAYIVHYSEFDSRILDRKTARIILDGRIPYQTDDEALRRLVGALERERVSYASIRFPINYQYARILEDADFRLADSILYLYQHVDIHKSPPANLAVRSGDSKDLAALKTMTEGAFIYGRFYHDPVVSRTQADGIYISWLENSLKREVCDELFVVNSPEGIPAGYLGVKIVSSDQKFPLASIELVLVDKSFRGKGYSRALIDAAFDYALKHKIRTVLIDTQLSNTPAIRSYLSAGFSFGTTYLTYRISL